MRTSSKIGIAVAALLLAAGLFLAYVRALPQPTPEQAIRKTLQDAEEAAKARRSRDVMETVSDSFRAGPLTKKLLNLQLMRGMQNGRGVSYDVHVNEPKILPSPKGNPDERLVITRFAVFYSGSGDDIWNADQVTLVMRKESRRKWLFFEEPRWRVVSVANLPPLPGSEEGGSGIADLYGG